MQVKRTPLERFLNSIEVTATCWLWVGSINNQGYGTFYTAPKSRKAHRVSYEHFVGPIPEKLTIDHLCRVRNCVNPDHLEVVTQGVNTLRGMGSPALNARKTHCVHGHKLAGDNLKGTPNRRLCIICRRRMAREWAQRNRVKQRLMRDALGR